jgi:hypothetical protein
MFLTDEELVELTGWKIRKRQVEHLRKLGIPFFTIRHGEPRVTRASVEGRKESAETRKTWEPTWGKAA